jgi:hypothetical protein
MDWIWRVQNDDSETDLSVLWTHLSGGDDWHRRRFQQAWLDYSGLETPQEAFNRGGMAGWEGFKEGVTFGGYQAPDWARRTEGFGISRGIGQATAIFELSVVTAGIGQALGASGGLGAGVAGAGATAATRAAGAAGGATGVSGRGGITGGLSSRSLSARIADFRTNPGNWERVYAGAGRATSRNARGGVSIESVYRNRVTGETLHVHDVFTPSGAQIPKHPTFRDYGKGD